MILALLQARTRSTRLPGKVLKPILGKPLLALQLERVGRAKRIDLTPRVIATRQLPESGDDAKQTMELAREIGADWVVLDGYQFATEYQRAIKNAGRRLLVVDDDGCAGRYVADLILNPNPFASPEMYRYVDSDSVLLLGTRYALLRREFLPARPANRHFASCARSGQRIFP
jgi:UDP-2,4-diacetamido-2,4,6-trideoxy-beta-L-altropyranose hydrolase